MTDLPYLTGVRRQPTCPCCAEPLLAARDASLRGTEVRHRGWVAVITDGVLRDLRGGDLGDLACAWMASRHHEAALELCGEITETYKEAMI